MEVSCKSCYFARGIGWAAEAEYCEMLSEGRLEKQWKTSLSVDTKMLLHQLKAYFVLYVGFARRNIVGGREARDSFIKPSTVGEGASIHPYTNIHK